jgi:hypothetical protein
MGMLLERGVQPNRKEQRVYKLITRYLRARLVFIVPLWLAILLPFSPLYK